MTKKSAGVKALAARVVRRPRGRPAEPIAAAERAAIAAGIARWRVLQDAVSTVPEDANALAALGTAARQMAGALSRFTCEPASGHMASLLGALQMIDMPLRSQSDHRSVLDRLHEQIQVVADACELVAPKTGLKIEAGRGRLIWCAADEWHRTTGEKPDRGRFCRALIDACDEAQRGQDRLPLITPDNVKTVLARWRRERD